jgi:hypothetical protein
VLARASSSGRVIILAGSRLLMRFCRGRQARIVQPAAPGYEIAGTKLKKVGQGLTWTPGLQDMNERNLWALRRLGKGIRGQTIAI